MGLFTARQPDDRGTRVPIINMHRRRPPAELREVFSDREWKRIRDFLHQRSSNLWPLIMLVLIVVGVHVGAGVGAQRLGLTGKHEQIGVGFVRSGVTVGGMIAIAWLQWKMGAKHTRAELIYRRRCASCGYSIDGFKPDEDGCTVCPECGAAWNLASRSS